MSVWEKSRNFASGLVRVITLRINPGLAVLMLCILTGHHLHFANLKCCLRRSVHFGAMIMIFP